MQQSTFFPERNEEITIFDEADPASVISMVPDKVREALLACHAEAPKLFDMDEQSLDAHLRKVKIPPSATDNRLRLKFWIEYDRCKADSISAMTMTHVISNICSKEFFYNHYLKRPSKCAWLLCPPISYSHKLEEALEFGLEQLRDILSTPHWEESLDRDGLPTTPTFNAKIASLKLSVFKTLDDRKHGIATQRIESTSKSLSITAQIPASDRKLISQLATQSSEEDLYTKLEQAKKREREALHLPNFRDLTTTDEDPT